MTFTRPTYCRPQTIAQAKKEYRKHGPRISSQEQRQMDRGAELYRRAEKIREAEKRRKENAKRRQEKEQREREARRRMGIASQKPYASPHQLRLETFVQNRHGDGMAKMEEQQVVGNGQDANGFQESWVEDDIDDGALLDTIVMDTDTENIETATDFVTARSMVHPVDGHRYQDKRLKETKGTTSSNLDNWDDFLTSNTQIERDISSPPMKATVANPSYTDSFLDLLSTQDVNTAFEELEELDLNSSTVKQKQPQPQPQPQAKATFYPQGRLTDREWDSFLMPPPRMPPPKKASPVTIVRDTPFDDILSFDFTLSTQDCREIG